MHFLSDIQVIIISATLISVVSFFIGRSTVRRIIWNRQAFDKEETSVQEETIDLLDACKNCRLEGRVRPNCPCLEYAARLKEVDCSKGHVWGRWSHVKGNFDYPRINPLRQHRYCKVCNIQSTKFLQNAIAIHGNYSGPK